MSRSARAPARSRSGCIRTAPVPAPSGRVLQRNPGVGSTVVRHHRKAPRPMAAVSPSNQATSGTERPSTGSQRTDQGTVARGGVGTSTPARRSPESEAAGSRPTASPCRRRPSVRRTRDRRPGLPNTEHQAPGRATVPRSRPGRSHCSSREGLRSRRTPRTPTGHRWRRRNPSCPQSCRGRARRRCCTGSGTRGFR